VCRLLIIKLNNFFAVVSFLFEKTDTELDVIWYLQILFTLVGFWNDTDLSLSGD
jgi:hypothetical protein